MLGGCRERYQPEIHTCELLGGVDGLYLWVKIVIPGCVFCLAIAEEASLQKSLIYRLPALLWGWCQENDGRGGRNVTS